MNLPSPQSIVADHLFFSEVGEGSVERTVLIMLWHVKEANQLIQAKVRLNSTLFNITSGPLYRVTRQVEYWLLLTSKLKVVF